MNALILPTAEPRSQTISSQAGSSPGLVFQRLLAPTDFSEPSLKALDYALALASPSGAIVRALHVVEPTQKCLTFDPSSVLLPDEESVTLRQAELERIAQERRHQAAKLACHICVGRPVAEIVQAAIDFRSDLLVISTHGRTGLNHLLMGSVAERVVRHAPCPVLVVRKHERELISAGKEQMLGVRADRILVPVDFSPRSIGALRYAARFARTFGGKITVFHSLNLFAGLVPSEYPITCDATYREVEETAQQEARKCLAEHVAADLADEAIVRTGLPLTEITAFAQAGKFDLIICATRSAAPLHHTLLGSTAEQIMRHADCPVLVVGDTALE